MVKNKVKKILCTIVAVGFVLSLVTGCASKNANDSQKGSQDNMTQKVESSDTTKADENSSVSMYPIVDKPITLKYWTQINPNASQYIQSYNDNEVYKKMEEITGINIEFIHPAQGQVREQFNILIASGEFPDIIDGAQFYAGGEAKGVNDGVFSDLTDKIKKFAPDYYKLVTSDPEIKREVTNEDGKFVAFYRIKPVGDPPSRRIMIRKDWLKELGIEIPKTIDEYENMFKALKEKKNIVPYLLAPHGMEEQFMAVYGIMPNFYLKDGNTIEYGQIQPEFKEYLTLMNKWYMAGYIDKDFPSLQGAKANQAFDSGKVAMYVSAVVATFNRSLKIGIEVDSAPYPRLQLGDKLHGVEANWPRTGNNTVISSTSKYVNEAMTWINYAYTEEGSRLFNFGIEDKTYVMKNGKPKYTDYILNNPNFTTEPSNYILRVHFAPKLCLPDTECNPNLFKSPASLAIRMKWADDPNVDDSFRVPPIQFTNEQLDKRASIMTEVYTYVDEMVLKFIFGAEPLSNFDEYVNHIKKLGIDEAVKITQDAYDRYLNKK